MSALRPFILTLSSLPRPSARLSMSFLNQIEEQLLRGVHASGAPSDIPTAIRIDYEQRVGTRTTYLEGGGVHRVPVVIPGFSLILRTGA